MRREEWKKDLAPLAFRVLPQPEEFFDSWLDRLAQRHDTSRNDLFEFLGLEAGIARLDLASGLETIASAASIVVIERLAWAVQCKVSVVQATFVPASGMYLLPPRVRYYGCPQCWLESCQSGRPLMILREWVLRQSWHCRMHEALLVDCEISGAARMGTSILPACAAVHTALCMRSNCSASPNPVCSPIAMP